MSRLSFKKAGVVELLEHSRESAEHRKTWGDKENLPGLLLVKDDGIYLMSTGIPGLGKKDGGEGSHVVYARGYGKDADYDRIRDAAGGDDFSERLPLSYFEGYAEEEVSGDLKIDLGANSLGVLWSVPA